MASHRWFGFDIDNKASQIGERKQTENRRKSSNGPEKYYSLIGDTTNRLFGIFNVIPIVANTYGCGIVPEIQATLAPPVEGKMLKGLCVCYVVVALSFFSVAISGYWAFRYQAAGLIFSNFVDDYSKPLAPKWLIYLPNICTIAQLLANGVHIFVQSKNYIDSRSLLQVLIFFRFMDLAFYISRKRTVVEHMANYIGRKTTVVEYVTNEMQTHFNILRSRSTVLATMILQLIPFSIIVLIIFPLASETYQIIAKPGCNSTCGEVSIPYPFGMKDPECYADGWFEIECKDTSQGQKPYLKSLNLQVTSISDFLGLVTIMNPIYRWNCPSKRAMPAIKDLRGSPFVYSQESNKFVAVGCNNLAFLKSGGDTVGGCVSICDNNEEFKNMDFISSDGCHGRYCCETSLPNYLSEYNATLQDFNNQNSSVESHQCSSAFIVNKYWSQRYYMPHLNNMDYVDAVLEWEILNNTLSDSVLQFLSDHARCHGSNVTSSFTRVSGYTCRCIQGYQGNPYVRGGCTALPDYNKNLTKKWAIVGVSSSLGSIILLLCLWLLYKVVRKRMIKKRKQKFFKKNGGLLLQQRMSSNEVNVDRAILFSLKDLEKATDRFNMNRILGKGGQGTVYKGMLVDGKIVAVKKFKVEGNVEEFINEFVILSQINNRNVVKLLGCCLETEIPLLVYEFIPNGNLFQYLHDQNEDLPMTWDLRLRIATEIAGALFYLHSVASQPIYHRDIKSTNILLDEKYRAKIADFGASRIISIEDTHLTTVVQGTFGYLDPEYFHTSQFTEKSDVYSFGVVLAELLTGQKPISSVRTAESKNLASYFVQCMEEDNLFDIIDKRVVKEAEKGKITAVANLVNRCLELNGKKRPTMKEVTFELERIQRLDKKSNAEQNREEIELARIEDYQPWVGYSISNSLATLGSESISSDSEELKTLIIDIQDGTVGIKNPIFHLGCGKTITGINLEGSPFVYSQNYNSFVGVGCQNAAILSSNDTILTACVSMCYDDLEKGNDIDISSCRGSYCCETSLPPYLSAYNISTETVEVKSNIKAECSNYLLIRAEYSNFKYVYDEYNSSYWVPILGDLKKQKDVPAVLEWEIPIHTPNNSFPEFRTDGSYNCSYTNVTSSLYSQSGWRCSCRDGFEGNPYIQEGCKFVATGDSELRDKRKTREKWAIIGVSSSLGTIILLLGLWWLNKVVRKNIEKKRKEKFFKQNGGLLLKQRLSSGEANVDKIKLFTLKDLDKATDHFNINRVLGKGGQGTVYKGMLVDGNIVAVKKFKVNGNVEEFINEFVILSQINHRNVVKLLGCCLETEIPLLVYEFIPNGNLYEYLLGQNDDLPMTWDMRLRIATEVAGALFYLHSAASQPIYHRDIKSRNILLDGKYKAKVADFGASRMVSIEATHLTTAVQGTFGYMDPEYFHTSQLTDKSDVYSFGVVLIELLTGKEPISSAKQQELRSLASYFLLCMEENRLFDIIDERIVKEAEKEHIVVVANLARRCLELKGKRRPTMKEVTSELESIQKSRKQSASQEQHDAGIDECQFWSRNGSEICLYHSNFDDMYLDETITSSQYENMTIARPGCDRKCGNVFIPFPFGMGRENCYASSWFEIDCRNNNTTTNSSGEQKPYLKYIDLEVKFIDLWKEALIIMNPIYQSGKNCERNKTGGINLKGGSPFVYSARYNTFLAVGCGNTASFWSNGEEVSGCASMCNGDDLIKVDNCRGRKCCEASLPRYLSEYNVSFEGQECAYGLIIAVRLGYWNLTIKDVKHLNEVPAVLEWEIPFDTFYSNISFFRDPDIVSCYDTYLKHSLNNSSQSSGRRCRCRYGAPPANPYIRGSCLEGYSELREKRKTRVRWAIIGVSSSLGTILLLLVLWWLNKFVRKNIEKKRKEKFFKQNGGLLLNQKLSSGKANVDKIKLFTLKDLDKATDHFNINRVLGKGGQGTVYKGMLVDGNIVAVKKFKVNGNVEEFINEFVVLSQINHRNVVKLLGCCLETEIPLLVYEFIPNGNLYEYLLGQNDELPMTWDMRLRIATEVAGALFYLHSAASQPIYHRDVKSTNILLDEKYKAKVADFGASRMVSIEATHLTTAVQGTFGYLDPEYFHTSQFTEKSDVYSFGVVLVELLTGQKPISSVKEQGLQSLASYFLLCMEENRLFDIVDARVMQEGEKEDIIVVANLARRCLQLNGRKRPTMKEVTLELESIQKLENQCNAQEQQEELELAGNEDSQFWAAEMVLKFAYIIVILMIWCMYPLTSAQYLDETITSSQYENMTIARPGCDRKCGNVFIPFPFGMGRENCYASSWFEIDCRNNNTTTNSSGEQKPYLKYIDLEVKFIDLWNEALIIMNPIYQSGKNCERDKTGGINLKGGSPFVYSARYNTFLAVGCGNTASFWSNGEEVRACASMCNGDDLIKVANCRGRKCCQTSLPRHLSEYNVSFDGQECAYGLIIAVRLGYWNLTIKDVKHLNEVPAVLEWEIPFDTFYSNISFLIDPAVAICYNTSLKQHPDYYSGKLCRCRYDDDDDFKGSPYIRGSCKGVFSSLGTIILLFGLWWLRKVVRKKIAKKRKEKFFKQNGGLLLEQRLSTGEDNVDKTKLFSLKELGKATDHFNINRILGKGGQGTVYKGMLVDGKIVAVKKFKVNGNVEEFINEFVILSQINHRNVVKLLGCCLETEIPLLVYEFIPNGNLYEYLLGQNDELPMTWEMRLRIATEVAGALFYLHSAASQPIYHRDVKSTNILLDEKYKAKVADFGASRMVSIEATHLTTAVQGTFGYLDPEYFQTSQFTEKSDVYSFGVVLVELLTGQKPISSVKEQGLQSLASYFLLCMEENRLFDIVDARVMQEGEKEHIIVVANLARRCLQLNGRKRPTMKEVSLELERIQKLGKQCNAQEHQEELELAGNEDSQFWAAYSTTSTAGQTSDSKTSTLEIMPILIK
ncbi:Wall-associated receptor kinase-like 8 [Glycine soja]